MSLSNGHNGHSAGGHLRQAITALRDALADLHRRLIDVTRDAYEAQHGKVAGAGELLQLLTQNEFFAWLRPLSELLADLDALHAEPATEDLASAVRAAAEALVLPGRQPGEFWRRYSPLLQQNAAVAVAHGDVRRLLPSLPEPQQGGATLRERHHRALAKKRAR
jgi:hypothetical protein